MKQLKNGVHYERYQSPENSESCPQMEIILKKTFFTDFTPGEHAEFLEKLKSKCEECNIRFEYRPPLSADGDGIISLIGLKSVKGEEDEPFNSEWGIPETDNKESATWRNSCEFNREEADWLAGKLDFPDLFRFDLSSVPKGVKIKPYPLGSIHWSDGSYS